MGRWVGLAHCCSTCTGISVAFLDCKEEGRKLQAVVLKATWHLPETLLKTQI